MNKEENNLNNNEVNNDFKFFQPVSGDAPTENNVSEVNNEATQSSDVVESLDSSVDTLESNPAEPVSTVSETPPEPVQDSFQTQSAEQTPVQNNNPEPLQSESNFDYNINGQNTSQNSFSNQSNKRQLNPKFFILIGIIIAIVVAVFFIFKKGGIGSENLNQDFSGKYNTYINQINVYKNTVFHKVRMYYDSSVFKENKSIAVNYYKFIDQDKYPSGCQVITYMSSISEVDDNTDNVITRTAYGNYKDFLNRHSNRVKSNKGSKIKTMKIGGLEYKYFKGSITDTSGNTKYYVSFETALNDQNYYSVNYEGSVDIDNKLLKGFLNVKVEKYNSIEELKAGDE